MWCASERLHALRPASESTCALPLANEAFLGALRQCAFPGVLQTRKFGLDLIVSGTTVHLKLTNANAFTILFSLVTI